LNRPLIFATRDDCIAVAFGTFPRRAKSRGVELPSARASLSRLSVRLTGHFAVCGKDHLELSAARGGSGKWLAVEEVA
jgi:hypothetical protein